MVPVLLNALQIGLALRAVDEDYLGSRFATALCFAVVLCSYLTVSLRACMTCKFITGPIHFTSLGGPYVLQEARTVHLRSMYPASAYSGYALTLALRYTVIRGIYIQIVVFA